MERAPRLTQEQEQLIFDAVTVEAKSRAEILKVTSASGITKYQTFNFLDNLAATGKIKKVRKLSPNFLDQRRVYYRRIEFNEIF